MHLSPWMVRWGNFVTGHKMTVGAIVAFVADGEVLLVRSKHGERRWGLPGGVIGRKEHPVDGAARELREETGIRLVPADLEIVGAHVQEHGRHLDTVFRVVRGRTDQDRLESADAFEIAEAAWFPLTALPPLRHEAERARRLYPGLID